MSRRLFAAAAAAHLACTGAPARPAECPETGAGAAPSPRSEAPSRAAGGEKLDRLRLLCARIRASTSAAAGNPVAIGDRAAEGGDAIAYANGADLHITGELLGESYRHWFDYRFRGGELACSRDEVTSANTIMEQSPENPEGRPAFWRADFRVYEGGAVIHEVNDSAPDSVGSVLEAGEVLELAKELRSAAASAP